MKSVNSIIYFCISLLVLLLLSFLAGYYHHSYNSKSIFSDLESQNLDLIATAENNKQSYNQTIDDLKEENKGLIAIISQYENTPEKIKYITRIKTVIKGEDEIVQSIDENPVPNSHEFVLENGLPVASFEASEKNYIYNTYDLQLETDIVIGTTSTSAIVTAYSSADPSTPYKMPTKVSVREVSSSDVKLLELNISIGVTVDLDKTIRSDVYGSVSLPFLHLSENLDLLAPRFSFNTHSRKLGVDLISWNIASKLPLVSDIWISPGLSVDLSSTAGTVDLTLGSRF